MDTSLTLSPRIQTEFDVSNPVFVEQTQIATIWKVRRRDGTTAALKLYDNQDMRNERTGFAFIAALNGDGAAHVFAVKGGAVLMEWLDGPSLGDLTRDGQDRMASQELVAVANRIHARKHVVEGNLPTLSSWFQALFDLQCGTDLPRRARQDMRHCQNVAQRLLASQQDIQPLHGDLHHDNIRLGARGYCAFDAKGVRGERTYELANAFRNPKGAPDIVHDPDRIRFLAADWSVAFDVDRQRLLEWAMVKVALSISWRSGPLLNADRELGLLSLIRQIIDAD